MSEEVKPVECSQQQTCAPVPVEENNPQEQLPVPPREQEQDMDPIEDSDDNHESLDDSPFAGWFDRDYRSFDNLYNRIRIGFMETSDEESEDDLYGFDAYEGSAYYDSALGESDDPERDDLTEH